MDHISVIEEVQLWKHSAKLGIIATVAPDGFSLTARQIIIVLETLWILFNAHLVRNALQIVESMKFVELDDMLALLSTQS